MKEDRIPCKYPIEVRRQVTELARSGTRAWQLEKTFGMSQATIYNWIRQDKIDRGEIDGLSTNQQVELAAAKKRGTPNLDPPPGTCNET